MKRVESRRIFVEELLARICQDICDKARAEWGAALSNDSDSKLCYDRSEERRNTT